MPINISTSPGIFHWRPACWLRISGADAFTFLQGQFTNDLRLLDRAAAVYGLWLTLKGKVLADSFVLRAGPDAFWVGSYFSSAAVIRERLESHVIADDVVIADVTEAWAGISVLEGEAAKVAQEVPASVISFPGRRTGRATDLEFVYPCENSELAELSALRLPVLETSAMELHRIGAGIPRIPQDVGPGDLPNEGALEASAISYTKGCYLGQEVMARLKSMGQVRRRLWRVQGTGPGRPNSPAPVYAGGRQVGELRSAVADGSGRWFGLAMVTIMHVSPGAELSFTAGGGADLRLAEAP